MGQEQVRDPRGWDVALTLSDVPWIGTECSPGLEQKQDVRLLGVLGVFAPTEVSVDLSF